MEKFIAAIDQGTTSTRCVIFGPEGTIKGISQKEHRQIYPQSGWVEHDPLEIWENTQDTLLGVLKKCSLSPANLAGIGITNQRETTILWDRNTGQPVSNAIVWQDTRTDKICGRLEQQFGKEQIKKSTGLPISTYFSAPKIIWLLENIEDLRKKVSKEEILFGTVDSWLIWNLTGGPDGGVHVTDVTNASRTMLMNLSSLDWDPELINSFDIPKKILPDIVPSSQLISYTKTPFRDVPITGVLGDQQAALFGQTCFNKGEAKNTYGTGCFLLLNTGNEIVSSQHGLLTTVGYQIDNNQAVYCLEGSIAITGALVQWLRDNLGIIKSSSDIEYLAGNVENNGGVYFVPAFSGLFAPYWRSDARGLLIGLTHHTTAAHIARAILEATAFQTKDVIDVMYADSGVELHSLKVDGGMVANELLMQFQADILDKIIIRPQVTETTALGAAYAAGLASGYWDDIDDLKNNWLEDKTWQPIMAVGERNHLYSNWKKAVERTFNWVGD